MSILIKCEIPNKKYTAADIYLNSGKTRLIEIKSCLCEKNLWDGRPLSLYVKGDIGILHFKCREAENIKDSHGIKKVNCKITCNMCPLTANKFNFSIKSEKKIDILVLISIHPG